MPAVEVVAARVTVGRFTVVIVVIYRLGSDAVQSAFYEELTKVFETVATYQVLVFVAGDFNIHFECCDNPNMH